MCDWFGRLFLYGFYWLVFWLLMWSDGQLANENEGVGHVFISKNNCCFRRVLCLRPLSHNWILLSLVEIKKSYGLNLNLLEVWLDDEYKWLEDYIAPIFYRSLCWLESLLPAHAKSYELTKYLYIKNSLTQIISRDLNSWNH